MPHLTEITDPFSNLGADLRHGFLLLGSKFFQLCGVHFWFIRVGLFPGPLEYHINLQFGEIALFFKNHPDFIIKTAKNQL